ncbi:MAG: cytidylate kinase-like family protein [Lachnospira sp.]|nr:cytidylate kinase-like family protein [Lachnospira sp.]
MLPNAKYPDRHFVVTVGCEYGSGGPEIAKMVADRLGIEYYNRDLVDKVVQQIGVDKGLVEEADTKIGVRYGFDTSYGVRYANLSNRVIDAQFEAIHDFAKKSSCVIVGRSSDYILRDRDDVINVFIYAPQEDEIAEVMREKNIKNPHKAKEEWEATEKAQHARHEYITGKKRGDRHTRDILLNSSLLGWSETADFIIDMIDRKFTADEQQAKKGA